MLSNPSDTDLWNNTATSAEVFASASERFMIKLKLLLKNTFLNIFLENMYKIVA